MSIDKLAHELRLAGARACRCWRMSWPWLGRQLATLPLRTTFAAGIYY